MLLKDYFMLQFSDGCNAASFLVYQGEKVCMSVKCDPFDHCVWGTFEGAVAGRVELNSNINSTTANTIGDGEGFGNLTNANVSNSDNSSTGEMTTENNTTSTESNSTSNETSSSSSSESTSMTSSDTGTSVSQTSETGTSSSQTTQQETTNTQDVWNVRATSSWPTQTTTTTLSPLTATYDSFSEDFTTQEGSWLSTTTPPKDDNTRPSGSVDNTNITSTFHAFGGALQSIDTPYLILGIFASVGLLVLFALLIARRWSQRTRAQYRPLRDEGSSSYYDSHVE